MADLVLTVANVVPGATSTKSTGTANDTITQGQSVNKDPTDGKIYRSDNNSATAARRRVDGISLNAALAGQPVDFLTGGDIVIGATVAVGTIYCLSGTAGGICPAADLVSGMETTVIGVATSATNLNVLNPIYNSGVLIP